MTHRPIEVAVHRVFPSGDAGGNVAGVVLAPVPADRMPSAARTLGLPTVAFATAGGGTSVVEARMFTVDGEIGSCGHAAAAVAAEVHRSRPDAPSRLTIRSPGGDVDVTVDGPTVRPNVAMSVSIHDWSVEAPCPDLRTALGVPIADVPVARVVSGLTHLVVTVASRRALAAIGLDHERWRALGRSIGVDTIGVVAIGRSATVHLRDICAPIGDTEEAASGTTASAVTWHLARLGRGDRFDVHQGRDMGSPSLLRTEIVGAAVEVRGAVKPVGVQHLGGAPP